MRPLLRLAFGLLVVPIRAPLADPPMGGHDDWHGGYGNHAQERRQPDDRRRADRYDHRDRYDRDAARAAESVRRDERGRVLSSHPDDRGYRVRVLTPDGYVRERYVDPRDDRDGGRHYPDRD